MNFKTTVILMILLLGFGIYFIIDRTRDKNHVETTNDTKKLFDVKDKDDVNSLTIKSADGSEIVLTKADGKWRMTKPVEAAAEGWQVDRLVSDLIGVESQGEVDPKDKGLDKPKLNVEVSAKGGKVLKFAVGNKTPLGALYIQIVGHKDADVISADLYDRLSQPANELRDKQLVSAKVNDIKQLTIDHNGQKLFLQKKGSDWELVEPEKLPADPSTMTDILGAVTGLRASDWVAKDSPDVATAKFESPQMTVSFTTTPAATQPATAPASQPVWTTITFGQFEDIRHQKVYARISDTNAVVKVSGTPIETFSKKPIELRDKKVADIVPEQVSRIDITTSVPAGPAPTTKPGKKSEVVIERRKEAPAAPTPATKPAATKTAAKPAAKPATTHATAVASTQAATAPVAKAPASPWELKSDPKGDADEDEIQALLAELHPLKASKFLEAAPTPKATVNYTLKVTTEGPGGTPITHHELKLVDPGGDAAVLGEYNGLHFELPRTFLTKLEGNFAKKPKATTPQPALKPEDFKGPGEK
jgi:hypothetical protein